MIKSIVVQPKPIVIKPGNVFYTGSSDYMWKHTVLDFPVYSGEFHKCWKVNVMSEFLGTKDLIEKGHTREERLYLGDEGVPGYEYDDRPCKLAHTPDSAIAKSKAYAHWRLKGRFQNVVDYPSLCIYHDGDI